MAAFLLSAVSGVAWAAAPVTRAQLRDMASAKVDPAVIRALVERDCVDFDVTGENAAELSKELPAGVLETIIRCRKANAAPAPTPSVPRGVDAEALPDRSTASESGSPAPSVPPPTPVRGPAELRVTATFIAEASPLSCVCLLDGKPFATLAKPAQGEFGENVPRNPVKKDSGYLPVEPGRHELVVRCEPKDQELRADVTVESGRRRRVDLSETTLRRWKIRRNEIQQ